MTSHFKDGGHDVRPPFTAAYAAASASSPLVHRARLQDALSAAVHDPQYIPTGLFTTLHIIGLDPYVKCK